MKYLLDTNVISEARKPAGDPAVKAWLRRQAPQDLAISVITVLEIDIGIHRLRRRDPAASASIEQWLDDRVLTGFRGRILSIDIACARRAAPMHVPDPVPDRDALIAGTALVHGLVVVTRNAKDFGRTGVAVLNPWEPQSSG